MEDLTGRVMSNLVPSSMHGGNTTADDRKFSMSAPGSQSVLPVPPRLDNLPLPEYSGSQIPVGHPGRQQSASAAHPADGGGRWVEEESTAGKWKVMP
jgi:hypothetical protein